MTLVKCELIRINQLIEKLKVNEVSPMKFISNNQGALSIASNPFFHERSKHIEVNCHFIKYLSGCIVVSCISYNDQLLANIFSKSLRVPWVDFICNKLGA
jgi:hypothetical protein